ncbi:MAG: tyrosine-type recombinase/integrase [Crocinitomicaceae bacterium]|nr:tyrosine-type recombinase/integrase [Crocinitomicaceae bacterium]
MAPFFVFNDFESYLVSEKRFSEHTVTAYLKDLEQFTSFALIDSMESINEVNHQLVRGWIVHLIDHKTTNRSVNRKLSTLRTFFKWLVKNGMIESDPMLKVKGPKSEKKLPSFAKESEMNSSVAKDFFSDDFDGIRDLLMVEMFYQTGIRLSELINLKDGDVTRSSIKVLGKRNKERIIPISDSFSRNIESFRSHKMKLFPNESHFFVSNKGNKLYPKFVYRKINSYLGSVTNLDIKSPHVLRHTFATHMLNNGAGLEVLKDILGHASLSATQVYTHNSFAQLNNIYSQAHPRGHKNKEDGYQD